MILRKIILWKFFHEICTLEILFRVFSDNASQKNVLKIHAYNAYIKEVSHQYEPLGDALACNFVKILFYNAYTWTASPHCDFLDDASVGNFVKNIFHSVCT